MKQILAIYDDSCENYVTRQYNELIELGVPVVKLPKEEVLQYQYLITGYPCFFFENNGKIGAKKFGKYFNKEIINWATGFNW